MFETWHQTTSIARYNLEILLDCYSDMLSEVLVWSKRLQVEWFNFQENVDSSPISANFQCETLIQRFLSLGIFRVLAAGETLPGLGVWRCTLHQSSSWRVSETRLLFDTCAGKTSLGAKNLMINWQSTASADGLLETENIGEISLLLLVVHYP